MSLYYKTKKNYYYIKYNDGRKKRINKKRYLDNNLCGGFPRNCR